MARLVRIEDIDRAEREVKAAQQIAAAILTLIGPDSDRATVGRRTVGALTDHLAEAVRLLDSSN